MNEAASPESPQARSGLWILLVGGLLVGGVMAFGVIAFGPGDPSGAGGSTAPTPIPDPVSVGEPAPDFTALTAVGETLSLGDFRGSPVAVNFWATWCAPCRVEMPALQAAYDEGNLVVLAVNAGESEDAVRAYMQELGLGFPALLDPDGRVLDLYSIRVFPTTVWIDSQGIVRAEHLGPLTPELIDRYIEELDNSAE